ncbi:hypothetical protein GUJ93_ZPchr0013g35530 [Zizania palustris]|uniref:Uncharacterized protein n=1 Tax=Zizania palustris TaxID=103762 RepID=A0A8J6BTJ2_ZIZPA|nr:hypothetical protein GUJ93_ZPchr0013g35530 [Zizania palustris]
MANCLPPPSRCRVRPTSPHLTCSASATAAGAVTTTVSSRALAKSPFVFTADGDDVIRVYGSNGYLVTWRIHVSLLYKATTPMRFMPSEVALLSHPVLCLSTSSNL